MSRNESVDALRKKIDQIDAKVVNLLNARASLAQRIGRSKSLTSQEVYVPNREKEILQRVSQLNRGPLPVDAVSSVFREIISGCRSLEAPLKVAFFGAEATYSHLAAKEKFGSSAELRSTPGPQCLVTDDGVVRTWLPSDAAQEGGPARLREQKR